MTCYLGPADHFNDFCESFAPHFLHITELDLGEVKFRTPLEAFNFVTKFQALTHLEVNSSFKELGDPPAETESALASSLRSLSVCYRDDHDLHHGIIPGVTPGFRWLLCGPSDHKLPPIKSLIVTSMHAPHNFSLRVFADELFHHVGRNLQIFSIQVYRQLSECTGYLRASLALMATT
jgi:hypothetical protein